MFKKKNQEGTDVFDTLIGINTIFEGHVVSDGTVRVDGKVKGDIRATGNIIVGTKAVIEGNIYSADVHLAGTVEGNIKSSGMLRMLSTAKLYGDIQIHSFVADEGAVFQGKCNMLEVPAAELQKDKLITKKNNRDYKKSTVINQVYDEKDSAAEL